uniref:Uncharacterized protein n=1 Tax=Piliocolobus tephrosceles TaxID=591936 RepID=A0A8C9LIK8_9PRIM
MRYNHNKLNLSSTNGPKITYGILLRKPHSSGKHSFPHSNPLKLHRHNYPYNCPWTYFIYTTLLSKLKL